ncbi:MAG: exodeoxyribonuclease VII small subunit [Gemmatimonadota bacterium]
MTEVEEEAGSPEEAEESVGGEDGELTLEARLRRLDEIVGQLEGGEVELERGLALFEEGVRHIRASEALLSQAELRVEELVGESESLRTQPMDGPVE